MLGLTDRIEDRHQAKRVLRRRIKPKRKRCCDRLSGPGPLFNLSRGVPKLPRGGEGLASVSLRPSLARPRRPATASYPLRAPESRRLSRHSRVRSFSAPPIVSGTREAAEQKDETILACNKTKTSDRVDLSIHGQAKTGSWERASGEEDSPTTPQPPPREKRTTFSRIATSHRTIRYSDTKSRTGARPQFIDQDCCAAVDDENHEQDSISVTTSDEHAHVLPENVRLNAEDAVVEPPPAEEKRVAAVVLSSTVLLGPRGRSRTPKELTDSPQSGGSYGGEALEERSSDRVNPSREILGRWFGQSSRYELANAPSPSGTERLVTDHETERLLANEDPLALLGSLWKSGGTPCFDRRWGAVIGAELKLFGTDEYAGDREIAFFVTAASLSASMVAAAATSKPPTILQHEMSQRLEREAPSPTKGVTLRAVPVHAGNALRRYNPYHLRLVHREVEGVPKERCTYREVDTDESSGDRDDARVKNTVLGAYPKDCVVGTLGEESSRTMGHNQRESGVEVAVFHGRGVVYLNIHGETSFQSLDEWRRDKERYDKLSQMAFCRSYPFWKYFRAFKKFVRKRRLDDLRGKVEKGLVFLDPVCRSALVEVVAQLNRLSPLQSVTAKKGTNALYTLSEFFDEQFRNTEECSRLLIEVYDRCGSILGQMGKINLEAEGLLFVDNDWNQALDVGSMGIAEKGSSAFASNHGGSADAKAVNYDVATISWAFAARKRAQCERIARASRWARQRMRQELLGLALGHAEQLLVSMSRMIPPRAAGSGGVDRVRARDQDGASLDENKVENPDQGQQSRLEQRIIIDEIENVSRWRNEARPQLIGDSGLALSIDEDRLGQVSSLALEGSLIERASVGEEDVREWREAFRRRVSMVGGRRSLASCFVRPRFRSRISLPDHCLSVSQAIHLACELVPHAEETLAIENPAGAKPILQDMFQSALTPNLCGELFFPLTHRFHGEQQGMTEDTFVLATSQLSARCSGGIRDHLSEISYDYPSPDQGEGNIGAAGGSTNVNNGHQQNPVRSDVGGVIDDGAGGDDYYASIIDTRVWEENAAKSSSLNSTAMVTPREVVPDHTSPAAQGALEETQRGEARRIGTPTQGSKGPTSRSGKSTEPRSSIIFEVVLGGLFDEWDVRVVPSLKEFVDCARFTQLGFLSILAGVPCLLEHLEVKPFIKMEEELTMSSSTGEEACSSTGAIEPWKEENTPFARAVKLVVDAASRGIGSITADVERALEDILAGCGWLEKLARDPYFRGVQDQVCLSLASTHNAVYRMVDSFRPLFDEFEALRKFAAERDARKLWLQDCANADEIAEQLVASGSRCGGAKLDLFPVFLARENADWLQGWYSKFNGYRRRVLTKTIATPQVLLSVNAMNLVTYLTVLPDACLEEIRQIGPLLLTHIASRFGAVLRRCNVALCDGLGGVDAMGEKTGFAGAIGCWLRRLAEEVSHTDSLAIFLKEIGCFDPSLPPATTSAQSRYLGPSARPASSGAIRTNGAPLPLQEVHELAVVSENRGGTVLSSPQGSQTSARGEISGDAGDPGWGDRMNHGSSFRTIASQVQEAVEGLKFHFSALQRTVDQAYVNLRVASQEFASLLTKELSSLGRDIAQLEADFTSPFFADTATDPTKACKRLDTYHLRLIELEDKEIKYRRYNALLDRDLCDGVAKSGAKRQEQDEKLRLDLERVAFHRKKLVLKWEVQRDVLGIRQEWEASVLFACKPTDMARRHAQAVRAHAVAVNVSGNMDSVAASCGATLDFLAKIVEVVTSLWNRNLTAAYWERIEGCLPIGDDLKATGLNKYITSLRNAAGLELSIPPAGDSATGSGGKGDPEVLKTHFSAAEGPIATDAVTTSIGKRQDPEEMSSFERISSDAVDMLSSAESEAINSANDKKVYETSAKWSNSAGTMSAVGRARREQARQRAEIYRAFPMAAEWGGLTLSTLLNQGLLDRRRKICAISAEATASATLRKTLEELEETWESVPMLFAWHFDEGQPAPGQAKQPPIVNDEALHRRRLYAKVLAEPVLSSRGFTAVPGGGGAPNDEDSGPTSEGFTPLLSNGDELLRLTEHSRVVIDNVVDAPRSLLVSGDVGKDARKWQERISWFQELITHWMATQEQWVRLAPAFIPEDQDCGVPTHDRARFTDISGCAVPLRDIFHVSIKGILGTLRAEKHLKALAASQGTERGGRCLLVKVCKLQNDLEVISHTLDRWLGSCAVICPRLLALPRHQIFRFFRDWATGRVGSGSAAGETNERAACMFRGVGEITWEEILGTHRTNYRTRMAAAGVRSSGSGLEIVSFSHPVPAIGRFEHWVRDVERQLVSSIARDVEVTLAALRRHGNVGPGRPPLLHIEFEIEDISDGVANADDGGKAQINQHNGVPTLGGRPSLQGSLLARGAFWTAAVEAALAKSTSQSRRADGGCRGAIPRDSAVDLHSLFTSLLQYVDGWATELREQDINAYKSIANAALVTQALHQRDIVGDLLEILSTPPEKVQQGSTERRSSSGPLSSLRGDGDEIDTTGVRPEVSTPFIWTCHLRHYSVARAVALAQKDNSSDGGGTGESGEGDESAAARPPPPLMKIGLGPWYVPYGFEYAGTMERLWLTPLSERCLLHAVHSAKGRLGGLLVPASGASPTVQHDGNPYARGSSSVAGGDDALGVLTAAQDVSVAFGRAFRLLHASCVTSPQTVSNVIASSLTAGAVSLFAGVDALPNVSLAVLAESLRAVMSCLHADQERVLVNGREVPLTNKPHQLPGFDPLLHQWMLLPWEASSRNGRGPFLGIFASLASYGPDPVLPLSLRAAFRPVLVAPPSIPLLFEAMLLTRGFSEARTLVRGVVQGLKDLGPRALQEEIRGPPEKTQAKCAIPVRLGGKPFELFHANTILHSIILRAVRTATELLVPETARELRAARRKFGLDSLTISERKLKTDDIYRAVEARVLVAGVARALLRAEIAYEAKRLPGSDGTLGSRQQPPPFEKNFVAAPQALGRVSAQALAAGPQEIGVEEANARRAAIVSALEESTHLRDILKPLVELESVGRKLAQRSAKARANELAAETTTATRSHDVAEFRAMLKRALTVSGMSPTKDQVSAAVEVWDALWSCRTPVVIVTGAAGAGKSAIFHSMPQMADYVNAVNRKLNKSLRKIASARGKQQIAASPSKRPREREGASGEKANGQYPNAVLVEPPGAIFEPPANARGAAPYRRIVNRQVSFVQYVNMTATFRKKARATIGDGGTVSSGASGSSKGTKATALSEISNLSGGSSDGGMSVFSQRSAGTKSSSASGLKTVGSGAKFSTGVVPRAAIEGSAFVIPAQEVEVVHTGGCSAEHVFGSTDEKGSWLDGHLLRRLRVLAEGNRGSATNPGTGRHRACGVGTGDVCPHPSGSATSGFSHGCKSRLLVLDGPISKLLEGIFAGDPASGSSLTGLEEYGQTSRCLLLPDGEALALDAWGHVAVETGDVRNLSPSTLTVVTLVHLRADRRALVKGLLEAWQKKQSRRKFHQSGATGSLNPVVIETFTEFFKHEDFVQGGCCLMARETIDRKAIAPMDASTSPSIAASRMRNTLLLLEGLLENLTEEDNNAVVLEHKTVAKEKAPLEDESFRVPDSAWIGASKGAREIRAISDCVRVACLREKCRVQQKTPTNPVGSHKEVVSETAVIESIAAGVSEITEETTYEPTVTKQEMTVGEAQEVSRRLRLRVFLLCVYASVWGMGGHLVGDASRRAWSEYIRQFAPIDLREHIREHNLFECVVDIRRAKLVPIGDDASMCPSALPKGMWTTGPHWAMQASEMNTALPPSLVIPSARVSSVATAAYTLLGFHGARVLVEGPSGAGKTALLSHLLRAMGKGIPDIMTGADYNDVHLSNERAGGAFSASCTGSAKSGLQARQGGHSRHKTASTGKGFVLDEGKGVDAKKSEEDDEKRDDETDTGLRVRVLDYARRQMADAGNAATVARADSEIAHNASPGCRRPTHGHNGEIHEGISPTDKDQNELQATMHQSCRQALPRSTVYLNMRRRVSTDDVSEVIGRALRREKEGVLEGQLGSGVVIFLDDVHLTQEVPGDGHGDHPCRANCCAAETLRGLIDMYTAVGEVRGKADAPRKATGRHDDLKAWGGSTSMPEAGLTRLGQVKPDFIPRSPAGPGGDSYTRPLSASILAARTTSPTTTSISPTSSTSMTLPTRAEKSVGGGSSAPISTTPAGNHLGQQQQIAHQLEAASANVRLWRRFSILALDAPSTAELRTVFSRACSDAFGGNGPVSSALSGPRSDTVLLSSETWTTIDGLGGIATEFLHRLHLRLRDKTTESGKSYYTGASAPSRFDDNDYEVVGAAGTLAGVHLDYFTLGRLLQPLVMARTCGISTPAAILRLWCHEIVREVVEPLPGRWRRDLAAFELAKLIRERASDIGVSVDEGRYAGKCLLDDSESPTMWTNTRGLVMTVAYGEQQAAKAIMTKRGVNTSTGENAPSVRKMPTGFHANDGVSYREVCAMEKGRSAKDGAMARVMVAHGVLLKTEDVFSPEVMSAHLARAVDILGVPWSARPDSQPIVTPQDVTNVCKCLRQLCLPRNPLVVVRTDCRGLSREGGPVSNFRLACALERARLVVMDGGTGRMCAKVDQVHEATLPPVASSFSFRAAFREAVLSCLGRGAHGPYLEECRNSKELRLNCGGEARNIARETKEDLIANEIKKPRGGVHGPNLVKGPLLPTKTVLLVQVAASLWDAGADDWALRALMDLVECGEVRRLFSDSELLDLAAEEEDYDRRMRKYQTDGAKMARGGSTFGSRWDVDSSDGQRGDIVHIQKTPRGSCFTRGGADAIYRRLVHYVRRSLVVALCLTDGEVEIISPSFPALSTCHCVRLETWSAHSMRVEATRSLINNRSSRADKTASTLPLAVRPAGSFGTAKTTSDGGGVRLWSSASHVNLVGLLAYGRFQSTVAAAKDVTPTGPGADTFERDTAAALEDAYRLFQGWMVAIEPACVQAFCAVRSYVRCGRGGKRAGGVEYSTPSQRWGSLKARCFSVVTEEGRGPREASLEEVLLLFKHICRLGCRKLVRRAQTLRRALKAAKDWGIMESRRVAEKVDLKQRKQDVMKALAENNGQVQRAQEEKLRVQAYWNEQSNKPREQREAQGIRMKQVDAALQPLKAAYETSKEALTTLGDDEMEFLCTLCLGHTGTSTSGEASDRVAVAVKQRQRGLHPELPFIVETVAVMLGNMRAYPRWIGEWVRLKASPSVRTIRSLLLDPLIGERLTSFDPDSQAGQKAVKVVLDKMTQRQSEIADTTEDSEKSVKLCSGSGRTNHDVVSMESNKPSIIFAREIPAMPLKLESRACGLLAAWIRDTVILVDAMQTAEAIRVGIHAEAKAIRQEEERIRMSNTNEVKPLDEELALRATYKSRFSTRLRHIHHRLSILNEIGIMRGAVEDSLEVCRQELDDLAEVARRFPGDALCFATLTCLATHLPHDLRRLALDRARDVVLKAGVSVSREVANKNGPNAAERRVHKECMSLGVDKASPATLSLNRYRLGHFASGVLTNIMQLQGWACSPSSAAELDEQDPINGAEGPEVSQDFRRKLPPPLPFHSAFMDAAMLTLSTPKWPLIVDPEGIALRWLRQVYPDQQRLSALIPASMVNLEVISTCAGKGELLPIRFTDGGVHVDLALFLGSDVLPDENAPSSVESGAKVIINDVEMDGRVIVGQGPDPTTVVLKPGFRIMLFTNSMEFSALRMPFSSSSASSKVRRTSDTSTQLVFLEDSPSALGQLQLIRFGGIDRLGVEAADEDNAPQLEQDDVESRAESQETSSSRESNVDGDRPFPPLFLAGMGLYHRPGSETLRILGDRMCDEIAGAFTLAVRRIEIQKAVAAVTTALGEAHAYSEQLSADHEAVVMLLTDRPPCFELTARFSVSSVAVLPGGEPRAGVSDDVEGNQNRVLNNLIETMFAYQNTLEKGVDTAPTLNRAAQAARVQAARKFERMARRLAWSGLRLMSRACDILNASGLDPVIYSPIFPGVLRMISGLIRNASLDASRQVKDEESVVLGAISRGLVARVPHDSAWMIPLAAMAATTHEYFPADGWWNTCIVLLADRHGLKPKTPKQLTLAQLFQSLSEGSGGISDPIESEEGRVNENNLGGEREVARDSDHTARGPEHIQDVFGSQLDHEDVKAEAVLPSSQDGVTNDTDSDENEDNTNNKRVPLSPQRWDLGFDTSEWTGNRSESTITTNGFVDGENGAETDSFCELLMQRWAEVKADRSKLTPTQALVARPFSHDDVLQRLVLLEVTMKEVFASLARHVMTEAGQWSQWIAKIRRCLKAMREDSGRGRRALSEELSFLLTRPPPSIGSDTTAEGQVLASSASPSCCSSDGSGDSDSSFSGKGGNGCAEQDRSSFIRVDGEPRVGDVNGNGNDNDNGNGNSYGNGTESDSRLSLNAPSDDLKPPDSEALCGGLRFRRDSRERMKLKLGQVGGIEQKLTLDQTKNRAPVQARREFTARASNLFGVSSQHPKAGVGLISARSVVQRTVRKTEERPDPNATHSKAMVSNDEQEGMDDVDEYITFVAESFRPRRDNSDWYRESKATPPPPRTRKKKAEAQGSTSGAASSFGLARATIDPKSRRNLTAVSAKEKEPPDGRAGGTNESGLQKHEESRKRRKNKNIAQHVVGLPKRTAASIKRALYSQEMAPSGGRGVRDNKLVSRRRFGTVDRQLKVTSAIIPAITKMHIFKQRRAANVLSVNKDELGSWSKTWNSSQLIGVVLLLALAPDGQLASQCAAACLLSGSKDDLNQSSLWRKLKVDCARADACGGGLQTALANSCRWTPTVIMVPSRDRSDSLSRHFMSVVSHIECYAGKAGARVVYHDASKPAHVRLARGVLVSQPRKAHLEHARARGHQGLVPADIEPAKMDMSQSAWEVCLKAALEGKWVVIADFEGIADHISLILDGLCPKSAVRSAVMGAAVAAAEEKGKQEREQRAAVIAGVVEDNGRHTSFDDPVVDRGLPAKTLTKGIGRGPPVATPLLTASGQHRKEAKMAPGHRGPVKVLRAVTTPSSMSGTTSTFPLRPDNALFKNLFGEGGSIGARSQETLSVAARRPLPLPHKNFRVILISTSPAYGSRDDLRSFAKGEADIVWWRPTPTPSVKGREASEPKDGMLPTITEECRVETIQELHCRYAVEISSLAEKETLVDMISRGLAGCAKLKGHGGQVPGDGAAINMHLAANLALEQASLNPVDNISITGAGGTSPSRADADFCGNSQRPEPGAFPPPKGSDSHTASSIAARSSTYQSFSRIVRGAIRESVTATEIGNAPIVDLAIGLLDAKAVRAREENLASVVTSEAMKAAGE